jgi:hypothetical protein
MEPHNQLKFHKEGLMDEQSDLYSLLPEMSEEEYKEFLKDNLLRTLGREKIRYCVFFDCVSCKNTWSIKCSQITEAVFEADLKGCPKCHRIIGVRLTHHSEIDPENDIDISDFIKVVAY